MTDPDTSAPDLASHVANAIDQSRRDQGWLDPDGVRRIVEELNECTATIHDLRKQLAAQTSAIDARDAIIADLRARMTAITGVIDAHERQWPR